MDEVILFDKSLQQRLQDYDEVFSGNEPLNENDLQREWAFYLELAVDPSGWQAIWKIERRTCEHLNIPYPSIVLVYILSIDLAELTALVKILAVQDDIHIPDKHNVPLISLWPTKHQEKSIALNINTTANALDTFRFFYNNLLLPWDYEEDGYWISKHLELRLRLYYDMKLGNIPKSTADHVYSLMSEAKRLQVKKGILEDQIEELAERDYNSVDIDNENVQTLTEMHIRMMEIKSQFEIYENPLMRSALVKKQKETSFIDDESEQNIWVIFDQGKASNAIDFLAKVQLQFPNETLHFAPALSSTLDCANPNDIFILKESTHVITSIGALQQGGILKGISQNRETVLLSKCDDIMLDFKCDQAFLENLTIEAQTSQCAIIVRKGTLNLNNCKLVGDGKSSTHQGIIVLSGACLEIVDCEISHFCTAIVGNSGSQIVIKNSEIHSCNYGLKIFDKCAVNATKATIRNCRDYGICVEVEDHCGGTRAGDFNTLSILPSLHIESMKGFDNAKGDAVINEKVKLKPVEDFFENPNLDPTIMIDSDDDEDVEMRMNTTLTEKSGTESPVTV